MTESFEHTSILACFIWPFILGIILSAFQSYETKTKAQLKYVNEYIDSKLGEYSKTIIKLKKQLEYFKQNSKRVNYYYSKMNVKYNADRLKS